MIYKKEIDGLRAIAVTSVVLSHLGLKSFQGGFVGVDIFFVISGFLITSLILKDIMADKFSFVDFYYRRAKRILPALFVMLFVVTTLSIIIHLPEDLTSTLKTLNYLSFFASNVYFSSVSGYFDTNSIINPLLHTWSLSVEEQYYIFFPVVLLLFISLTQKCNVVIKNSILILLSLMFLSSLIYAEQKVQYKPYSAFFMLQTRLWELMLGSMSASFLLAYSGSINRCKNFFRDMLVVIGIVMIFFAIFRFTDLTPTPGIKILIPTFGTVLIILFSRQDSFFQKILTLPPLTLIGLTSYSIYLWHQPVIAYTRYINIRFDGYVQFAITLTTFILGYFSWRFVEQPLRNNKSISKFQFLTCAGFTLLTFYLLSKIALEHVKVLQEFEKDTPIIISHPTDLKHYHNCSVDSDNTIPSCILGNKNNIQIALIGDSHANAFAGSFDQLAIKNNIGIFHSFAPCPPTLGLYRADMGSGDICHIQNNATFNKIINESSIRTVILSARWSLYVEKKLFDNMEGGREFGRRAYLDVYQNGKKLTSEEAERKKSVLKKYVESIYLLLSAGKKVILVYPVPEVGWVTPSYLARQMLYRREQNQDDRYIVSTGYEVYKNRNKRVIEVFDAIPNHPLLIKIKPSEVLCDTFIKNRCIASIDNLALYYDDDHLTVEGSNMLLPLFEKALH